MSALYGRPDDYRVIILSQPLAGLGPLETARLLKNKSSRRFIVVLLRAHAEEPEFSYIEAGARIILRSPVDLSVLRNAITAYLSARFPM